MATISTAWLLCLLLAIRCHAQMSRPGMWDGSSGDLRNLMQDQGGEADGDQDSPQDYTMAEDETGCTTQPTTLQVFTTMLEPVNGGQGTEPGAHGGQGTGMATVFLDNKAGLMYITGAVSNIHNLTAVTLNAGNSTEIGPVLLPLMPSMAQGQAQGGQNKKASINPFSPPLPWLSTMMFSQKVSLSDVLSLTSNATLNATDSGSASGTAGSAQAGNNAKWQDGGFPMDTSGNRVGAKPFSYTNVTDLASKLRRPVAVAVLTVYLADGTTVSSYNFSDATNTTDAGQAKGNTGDDNGQDTAQGAASIVPLMQAGLTYISVHTSQSGRDAYMRGQLVPFGTVEGSSSALVNAFPESLAPMATNAGCRTTNTQSNTTNTQSNTTNAANNYTPVAQEAGTRAGPALLANRTYVNLVSQVLPVVSAAMVNITNGTTSGKTLQGNYSTFAAALQAAADRLGSVGAGNASGNGNMGGGGASGNSGRRLLQAAAASSGKTVFAPTNDAIAAYLQSQGLSTQPDRAWQQLTGNYSMLLGLVSYHIVPTVALSTQNLTSLKQGRVQTLLPNATLAFSTTNGVLRLLDATGTATVITEPNVGSGKVWVHGINKVLVPTGYSAGGASRSAGVSGNASYNSGAGGDAGTASGGGRKLRRRLFWLARKVDWL